MLGRLVPPPSKSPSLSPKNSPNTRPRGNSDVAVTSELISKRARVESEQPPKEMEPTPDPVVEVYHKDITVKDAPFTLQKIKIEHEDHIEKKNVPKLLEWGPFITWAKKLKLVDITDVNQPLPHIIHRIILQSLDMKKNGKDVLFAKFKVNYNLWDKKNLTYTNKDGYMFMRGPAVAILVILIQNEPPFTKYSVVTKQVRMPVGIDDFREIPAGVVDKNNDVTVQAKTELWEETGLSINPNELFDLTSLFENVRHPSDITSDLKYEGMYPSPGGSDEYIRLYLYQAKLDKDVIVQMPGVITGSGSKEIITLEVVKLDELWRKTPEAKVLSALYLYEKALSDPNKKDEVEAKVVNMPQEQQKKLLEGMLDGKRNKLEREKKMLEDQIANTENATQPTTSITFTPPSKMEIG